VFAPEVESHHGRFVNYGIARQGTALGPGVPRDRRRTAGGPCCNTDLYASGVPASVGLVPTGRQLVSLYASGVPGSVGLVPTARQLVSLYASGVPASVGLVPTGRQLISYRQSAPKHLSTILAGPGGQ
jgi:hypothetical protein